MDRKNTYTFSVDIKVGDESFIGTFTVHRPNVGELVRIGVSEAQKLGGLSNVDAMTQMVAHMVATLETVVDIKPDWWKPNEIYDMEVLQGVFEKYLDYLRTFQTRTSESVKTVG